MRQDEEEAYREYVTARLPHLRRVAYLVCGDWHLAEDAVSTALAKLYVHWRRISQSDRLDGYVRTVVLRCVVDERRRPWSRERARPEWSVADQSAPDPSDAADDRIVLRRALQALPPGRRAVLVLRYYEGLSVEETADTLGVSTGTVKSQTARGLAALRDVLPEGFLNLQGGTS